MRMCSIASGSSGNCIYMGTENTHLLVDTGISRKKVEEGLHKLDLTLKDIDGILISHEHADHVNGLGVLIRKQQIPVYATGKTIGKILENKGLGTIPAQLFREVREEEAFDIKDIRVNPMGISHDAAQPVAYRFYHKGKKAGIVTDLGVYDEDTVRGLQGMDLLLLEANHDVRMLEAGPYPYYLKQRILGERGHLSNVDCGRLLSRLIHNDMQGVMLGHLSRENNLAELACETVRVEVTMGGGFRGIDFPLTVAARNQISEIISIQ